MGDKGTFKKLRRHGFYNGYDLSKYHRFVLSVCLGRDKNWGKHLANLMMNCYGVHGSTYFDGREWLFTSSSSRVFRDLSNYYLPEWGCRSWKVAGAILEADPQIRQRVAKGYFDADGYPNFSKARRQVSIKATSVNKLGLLSMGDLLRSIGFGPGVYRRYKASEVWELCLARQADVIRYYHEIGFSITRKQRKLGTMLAKKGLL